MQVIVTRRAIQLNQQNKIGRISWGNEKSNDKLLKELTVFRGGRGCLLREDTQSHSSLWWRDLKLVCDEGSPNKWFDRRLMWKICIGNQARFWLVNWVGMN